MLQLTFQLEGMLSASPSVMFCTMKSLKMNHGSGSDSSASGTVDNSQDGRRARKIVKRTFDDRHQMGVSVLRDDLSNHGPKLIHNRLRVIHALDLAPQLDPRLQERLLLPLVPPELMRLLAMHRRVDREQRGQVARADRAPTLERRELLARLTRRLVRRLPQEVVAHD